MKSCSLGQLFLRNVKNNTTTASENTGPTKLCRFLSKMVSHANRVWPMIGNNTCLPNNITNPEIARTEKLIATVQWIVRSNSVKRAILRPVGCDLSGIVPFHA